MFGALVLCLYDAWTLGMIPYHLIADDKEVARLVTQGERLSQPDNCPQQVYAIMQIAGRALKRIGQVARTPDSTARGVYEKKARGSQD
jgi:hypothetical protein